MPARRIACDDATCFEDTMDNNTQSGAHSLPFGIELRLWYVRREGKGRRVRRNIYSPVAAVCCRIEMWYKLYLLSGSLGEYETHYYFRRLLLRLVGPEGLEPSTLTSL